jgi:hypothetical protein
MTKVSTSSCDISCGVWKELTNVLDCKSKGFAVLIECKEMCFYANDEVQIYWIEENKHDL